MSDRAFGNPIFADLNPRGLCAAKLKQYGFTLKDNDEIVSDDTGKLLGLYDSVIFNEETNALDITVQDAKTLHFITITVTIDPGD